MDLLVALKEGGNKIIHYQGKPDIDQFRSFLDAQPEPVSLVKIIEAVYGVSGIFVQFSSKSREGEMTGNCSIAFDYHKVMTAEEFLDFLKNRISLTFPTVETLTITGIQTI